MRLGGDDMRTSVSYSGGLSQKIQSIRRQTAVKGILVLSC
jgi:hypothetical protein